MCIDGIELARGRVFVRANDQKKVFGGFVLSPFVPRQEIESWIADLCAEDQVWEVEISFVRKLSSGKKALGMRLDQAMTGGFLSDPKSLEIEGDVNGD